MLAELRRRPLPHARRLAQPRHDVVHRQRCHSRASSASTIDAARGEMRIVRRVRRREDRPHRRARLAHDPAAPRRDRARRTTRRPLRRPASRCFTRSSLVGKARIVSMSASPDHLEDAPRHLRRRARHREYLPSRAPIDVARTRGVFDALPERILDLAGHLVERRLRSQHRNHRLEQRQVDHLPFARARARARSSAVTTAFAP